MSKILVWWAKPDNWATGSADRAPIGWALVKIQIMTISSIIAFMGGRPKLFTLKRLTRLPNSAFILSPVYGARDNLYVWGLCGAGAFKFTNRRRDWLLPSWPSGPRVNNYSAHVPCLVGQLKI